jgi:integrase
MALTDTAIRNAKPGAKPIKLADEKGLFLLIQPSGGKLWRLKYRFAGKEKKLALGRYPDVGLKDARERCGEARKLIAAGTDPAQTKRTDRLAAKLNVATTFKAVADEYIEKAEREGRAEATVGKARWLLSLLEPALGSRPIADIPPVELLAVLKKIEAPGHLETARRMRSFAGRVFRYAVATARATSDPAAALKGALTVPVARHHGAILEPKAVGELLRAIDGYEGQPLTKIALQLAPHVFVRPGEMRRAEWSEFDLEAAVWRISGDKMKSRLPHSVPLSRQALSLLGSARELSGQHRYVFSSLYPGTRPMSENTINAALRRLGFTGGEMTAHGFRAMASTLLNESGKWHPDAIERALAHKDADSVRAAYHRGAHWSERVQMAQWWSDHLDTLRHGAEVVPIGHSLSVA